MGLEEFRKTPRDDDEENDASVHNQVVYMYEMAKELNRASKEFLEIIPEHDPMHYDEAQVRILEAWAVTNLLKEGSSLKEARTTITCTNRRSAKPKVKSGAEVPEVWISLYLECKKDSLSRLLKSYTTVVKRIEGTLEEALIAAIKRTLNKVERAILTSKGKKYLEAGTYTKVEFITRSRVTAHQVLEPVEGDFMTTREIKEFRAFGEQNEPGRLPLGSFNGKLGSRLEVSFEPYFPDGHHGPRIEDENTIEDFWDNGSEERGAWLTRDSLQDLIERYAPPALGFSQKPPRISAMRSLVAREGEERPREDGHRLFAFTIDLDGRSQVAHHLATWLLQQRCAVRPTPESDVRKYRVEVLRTTSAQEDAAQDFGKEFSRASQDENGSQAMEEDDGQKACPVARGRGSNMKDRKGTALSEMGLCGADDQDMQFLFTYCYQCKHIMDSHSDHGVQEDPERWQFDIKEGHRGFRRCLNQQYHCFCRQRCVDDFIEGKLPIEASGPLAAYLDKEIEATHEEVVLHMIYMNKAREELEEQEQLEEEIKHSREKRGVYFPLDEDGNRPSEQYDGEGLLGNTDHAVFGTRMASRTHYCALGMLKQFITNTAFTSADDVIENLKANGFSQEEAASFRADAKYQNRRRREALKATIAAIEEWHGKNSSDAKYLIMECKIKKALEHKSARDERLGLTGDETRLKNRDRARQYMKRLVKAGRFMDLSNEARRGRAAAMTATVAQPQEVLKVKRYDEELRRRDVRDPLIYSGKIITGAIVCFIESSMIERESIQRATEAGEVLDNEQCRWQDALTELGKWSIVYHEAESENVRVHNAVRSLHYDAIKDFFVEKTGLPTRSLEYGVSMCMRRCPSKYEGHHVPCSIAGRHGGECCYHPNEGSVEQMVSVADALTRLYDQSHEVKWLESVAKAVYKRLEARVAVWKQSSGKDLESAGKRANELLQIFYPRRPPPRVKLTGNPLKSIKEEDSHDKEDDEADDRGDSHEKPPPSQDRWKNDSSQGWQSGGWSSNSHGWNSSGGWKESCYQFVDGMMHVSIAAATSSWMNIARLYERWGWGSLLCVSFVLTIVQFVGARIIPWVARRLRQPLLCTMIFLSIAPGVEGVSLPAIGPAPGPSIVGVLGVLCSLSWQMASIQTAVSVFRSTPEVVEVAATGVGEVMGAATGATKSLLDVALCGFSVIVVVGVTILVSYMTIRFRDYVQGRARKRDAYERKYGGRLRGGMKANQSAMYEYPGIEPPYNAKSYPLSLKEKHSVKRPASGQERSHSLSAFEVVQNVGGEGMRLPERTSIRTSEGWRPPPRKDVDRVDPDKVQVGDKIQFVYWRGKRAGEYRTGTVLSKSHHVLHGPELRLTEGYYDSVTKKSHIDYRQVWTRYTSQFHPVSKGSSKDGTRNESPVEEVFSTPKGDSEETVDESTEEKSRLSNIPHATQVAKLKTEMDMPAEPWRASSSWVAERRSTPPTRRGNMKSKDAGPYISRGIQTDKITEPMLSILDGSVGDGLPIPRVVFFTGPSMLPEIMFGLESVQKSVAALQYCYDCQEVNTKLIFWLGTGKKVRMILDKGQLTSSSCKNQASRVKELFDAGCEIREFQPKRSGNSGFPVMHAKCVIIDGKVVYTGSVNLTHNGMNMNKEHMLRVSEKLCVSEVIEDYEKTWEQAIPVGAERMQQVMDRAAKDRAKRDKNTVVIDCEPGEVVDVEESTSMSRSASSASVNRSLAKEMKAVA